MNAPYECPPIPTRLPRRRGLTRRVTPGSAARPGEGVLVGDAAALELFDSGLGGSDELRDEGVVLLRVAAEAPRAGHAGTKARARSGEAVTLPLADDGHGGVVEHGEALSEEQQRRRRGHADEAVGRALDLPPSPPRASPASAQRGRGAAAGAAFGRARVPGRRRRSS